jgi:hypothetical protein
MVLLDRTHTLKVQQIQKEYQDFMERIRNKAQVRAGVGSVVWWSVTCDCTLRYRYHRRECLHTITDTPSHTSNTPPHTP